MDDRDLRTPFRKLVDRVEELERNKHKHELISVIEKLVYAIQGLVHALNSTKVVEGVGGLKVESVGKADGQKV